MEIIPQRELRNQVSDVLRRAEGGQRFVVTVGGRPVAELGPHTRRRWVARDRLQSLAGVPAPRGMLEDLRRAEAGLGDPFES